MVKALSFLSYLTLFFYLLINSYPSPSSKHLLAIGRDWSRPIRHEPLWLDHYTARAIADSLYFSIIPNPFLVPCNQFWPHAKLKTFRFDGRGLIPACQIWYTLTCPLHHEGYCRITWIFILPNHFFNPRMKLKESRSWQDLIPATHIRKSMPWPLHHKAIVEWYHFSFLPNHFLQRRDMIPNT